jgi:hypothetical protein
MRDHVRDVIDALIDIGDFTSVRLDGKVSLVISRAAVVSISDENNVVLGNLTDLPALKYELSDYARHASSAPPGYATVAFLDWLGVPDFQTHLSRRSGIQSRGSIREFWRFLTESVQQDGSPIDPVQLQVVENADESTVFFGRPSLQGKSGRWVSSAQRGTWCGVRPGRNSNEWHPILVNVEESESRALDLYDWDEWSWALLARGLTIGAPENSEWRNGVLAFHHPIPKQLVRALRLLGGPGQKSWTWRVSEIANNCFNRWRTLHF